MDAPPTEVRQWDEAVLWFLARVPMTKAEWLKLSARARRRAFTVAGVAKADVLRDVFKGIDRAVAKGTTLDEFRKTLGPKLRDAWQGTVKNPAWRLETIYRTNVQHAYSAGRWAQMTDPVVTKHRPFGMFDAILDNRVTERCEELDGTILAWEEWQKRGLVPPLHFNCRSGLRSLRKSQAEKKPGWGKAPPEVVSQDGFGLPPQSAEWKPDLEKYPPELRNHVQSRLAGADALEPMQAPEGARFAPSREPSEYYPPSRAVAEPAAPMPRPFEADPSGTPVGETFKLGGGRASRDIEDGLACINSVHGDGELPKNFPVQQVGGKRQSGAFVYDKRSGVAQKITINSGSRCPKWSTVHEVGHCLDHQSIGAKGAFCSEGASRLIKELMGTIKASSSVKQLTEMAEKRRTRWQAPSGRIFFSDIDRQHVRYLLQDRELFARAYAQYIAVRSGDKVLLRELARLKWRGSMLYYPAQWDHDEFVSIADAFDTLFERLGWLTRRTTSSTSNSVMTGSTG